MTSRFRDAPHNAADDDLLYRFTPAERVLHWATAAAVLTCAITGLILYVGPLSSLVGRRPMVKDVHVIAGLTMPVPLVLAYLGPWRNAVRADIRRLSRWTRDDRRWFWTRGGEADERVGKFNAGQKANAAFIAGMIPLMLASGSIMRWFEPFPLEWRTGATFVHDWTAIATWLIVVGHIVIALANGGALRAMITGRVRRRWAEQHHPLWAAEAGRPPAPPDDVRDGWPGSAEGTSPPGPPSPYDDGRSIQEELRGRPYRGEELAEGARGDPGRRHRL
jgi:formate dehydrogenase subunit gamma